MKNRPPTTDHGSPSPNGLLIIDKPADWTSHDVVAKVRGICHTRRVGHTGTLDPFATGVLVICLNQATRLVQFLTGDDKEYLATVRFGFATETGDLTGTPIGENTDSSHLNKVIIEAALPFLRGNLQQIPPMYSAKKIGGVKLYEMARRGEEIERQPVNIEISAFELIEQKSSDCWSFRVVCSSGTYVRTLSEDLGKQLGLGAHLTALRRTRAGNSKIESAITLEALSQISTSGKLDQVMIPMISALSLPGLQLEDREKEMINHGRTIHREIVEATSNTYQLIHQETLSAIAEYDQSRKTLKPKIVINN